MVWNSVPECTWIGEGRASKCISISTFTNSPIAISSFRYIQHGRASSKWAKFNDEMGWYWIWNENQCTNCWFYHHHHIATNHRCSTGVSRFGRRGSRMCSGWNWINRHMPSMKLHSCAVFCSARDSRTTRLLPSPIANCEFWILLLIGIVPNTAIHQQVLVHHQQAHHTPFMRLTSTDTFIIKLPLISYSPSIAMCDWLWTERIPTSRAARRCASVAWCRNYREHESTYRSYRWYWKTM